ncbi:hypothetical protein ACFL6S_36820 [Candidatus Poribacteria bacterium]
MINEESYKTILFDYAFEKYEERFQEFHNELYHEFPYKLSDLPNHLYLENFVAWLVFEKPLPATGKTIVEEFVDQHPDMDEELKQRLLRTQDVVSSSFVVLSKKGLKLKLKDQKTRESYSVVLRYDNPRLSRNSLVTGRIHPFGNIFRFVGIFFVQQSPLILDAGVLMEQFNESSIADVENMTLHAKSRMTAILNKYPFQWVDGICNKLGLSTEGRKNIKVKDIASKVSSDLASILESVPDKSREALKLVLDNGGYVRYGKLKGFDDEITFWWQDDPPTSTIGLLRLNALLAVGKMPTSGRMYKVALIPVDIRDDLQELL